MDHTGNLPGKCSLIEILVYLQGTSHLDTVISTHQCTGFKIDSLLSHKRAVKQIRGYQLDTQDKEMMFWSDTFYGLEYYIDAFFSGGGQKDSNYIRPGSVLSRPGVVGIFD
jgi:hypothetical protein